MRSSSTIPKTAAAILILCTTLVHADSILTFVISGRDHQFADLPEKHLTISAACVKEGGRLFSCQAYAVLGRASLRSMPLKERQGGANPGSWVCDRVGGHNRMGMARNGGENGFCLFHDGSLIDLGSLVYFARENDRKK